MTHSTFSKEALSIRLTRAEAIILEEFLARTEESRRSLFVDQSEQRVLWTVHIQLERALWELNAPEYVEILRLARDSVRDPQ